MYQSQLTGKITCCNGANVPDYGTCRIKIERAYVETSAALMLSPDGLNNITGDILGNEFFEWSGISHGVAECGGEYISFYNDVFGRCSSVQLLQGIVVFNPEKGKRSCQGTSAYTGHHGEFRSFTGRSPTSKQAGTEGTVSTAT